MTVFIQTVFSSWVLNLFMKANLFGHLIILLWRLRSRTTDSGTHSERSDNGGDDVAIGSLREKV
nr:10524_t:CDS:2 [Entrophospora candida]